MRLQRSRKKGWKKPENAVIVDRTSSFGNPFKVVSKGGKWRIETIGGEAIQRVVDFEDLEYESEYFAAASAVAYYGKWALPYSFGKKDTISILSEQNFRLEAKSRLAGKDLVCYCKKDMPCHADLLSSVANQRYADIEQLLLLCDEGRIEEAESLIATNEFSRWDMVFRKRRIRRMYGNLSDKLIDYFEDNIQSGIDSL